MRRRQARAGCAIEWRFELAVRPDGRAGCLGVAKSWPRESEITAARSVWLPDAGCVSSNEEGAVARVKRRRCVEGRPVIVTGSGNGGGLRKKARGGREEPEGLCEELQDRGWRFDEGGCDIARGLMTGAGAALILRVCWLGGRGGVLLEGTAGGSFGLRGRADNHAAAHRQSDAEAEKQGCEAGDHVVRLDVDTGEFIPKFQAIDVPGLRWNVQEAQKMGGKKAVWCVSFKRTERTQEGARKQGECRACMAAKTPHGFPGGVFELDV